MKAKVIFATNLVLGAGLLAFVFSRYGSPALAILGADVSISTMAAFGAAVAASIVSLSGRWGWILRGVCTPPSLMRLTLYRSAAHSLAVLVPSGKIGGDPLRAWLATRDRVGPGAAIASVAVDRTLELASTSPFSVIFAVLLLQHGVPQLERALVTVSVAGLGLIAGITIAARRLRRGIGLVTPLVQRMRLDRLRIVDRQMDVLAESDTAAARLVGEPQRMLVAFFAGLITNLLVILEFVLLLAAFGLPTEPTAVVAVIFATGAAHMLPIPAGIGVLEGANMWLFQMLGYPADVGLAVGLAARLRELIWMLPGVIYLWAGSLSASLSEIREP
ncbi:MAG: flippase-like domain-containing protein [Deltaproteobacteria bacterium]|nr:flippase-like domain-containing protein [Deltaproteobacteria bacterium]